MFYLPPTQFFREKLLLEKGPVLSDKQFALGSEIEGIPNCHLWVSNEDVFVRFGFELFWLKPIDISIAAPNLKKQQLRFLAKP